MLKRLVWLKRPVVVLFFCGLATSALPGQAKSTASRTADLQVGVGFVSDQSDYEENAERGLAAYATLDLSNHLGGELVFHRASSTIGSGIYEETFEIGPRYFRTYGRFSPYIKAMYGRGKFNFASNGQTYANLAYNMFAGGAGVDVAILPYLNVRADYEFQDWSSFPPSGLTPQLITIGVAYHFPGNLRRGSHY